MPSRIREASRVAVATAVLLWALPLAAGVVVDIDKETLDEILGAVSVERVEVPVSAENTITVELHDLRVTGFLPATAEGERHAIRTSVTVIAPELGLRLPLEPLVALDVVPDGESTVLELRFIDLGFSVPLMGHVNLAAAVPPMRYPATNQWLLDGARGPVPVTSRLSSIDMDSRRIRFTLDVDVSKTPGD